MLDFMTEKLRQERRENKNIMEYFELKAKNLNMVTTL